MANANVTRTARLDSTLESAVAQNWSELMARSPAELVHIEYQTDDHGSLECVKVWASHTRGHWELICEMWLQALWSNPVGLHFANSYRSPALAQALDLATEDGNSNCYLPNHHRLIQVSPPSQNDADTTAILDVNTAVAHAA